MKKGKKEKWLLSLPEAGATSGAWALLDSEAGPCGSWRRCAGKWEPRTSRVSSPPTATPTCEIQTGLPTETHARCTQHPAVPGLQELLKPPLQEPWERGFHLLQPSLVSPPTSGSILSTAVLQRLGYVFRSEGDGQRGQETQAGGSLCWHTAL